MNKKKLERAINIASSLDGSDILDKIISNLTKDQLKMFESFVKQIKKDGLFRYSLADESGFTAKFKIQYELPLSNNLQCIVEMYNCEKFEDVIPLNMEMVITIERLVDGKWKSISVGGDGKLHGFEVDSFDDAIILLDYFIYKAKLNLRYIDTRDKIPADFSNFADIIIGDDD